jgi:site-specific DNA-methyltransferase (cytosine-N4-specific)
MNQSLDELYQINWDFHGEKTDNLTHQIHPYPAKFIPQIPRNLILELSQKGDVVADIFCGSGTTLVEAIVNQRNAIGIDANPIACLISEAKTTIIKNDDVEILFNLVKKAYSFASEIDIQTNTPLFQFQSKSFKSSACRPSEEAIEFWFEPFVVEELAEILSWCQEISNEPIRKVALTAFSSIVVAVSKQDSDTRYTRRQKKLASGQTFKNFARSLDKIIKSLLELRSLVDNQVYRKVYHSNILKKPDIDPVDLIVCSPPYPNAYSYHLYHMTRMLWLGMDQPKFKKEEIGSHRKYSNKGANAATVQTFQKEMIIIFEWLSDVLKKNKYACLVIGDSVIKGELINSTDLISNVASQYGFHEVSRINRRMQDTKKAFNPTIGRIKQENILILKNKKR